MNFECLKGGDTGWFGKKMTKIWPKYVHNTVRTGISS